MEKMRFLRYFYYRLYLYYTGSNSVRIVSIFVAISVFVFFNILTLLNIYIAAFPEYDFDIPLAKAGWKRLIPGIVMLPFLGFWFYFFKIKGHSEKILMEFQNETKRAKFISSALVIIYGVGTILFFILSLFLRKHVLMH